jgi:hypothetical protein
VLLFCIISNLTTARSELSGLHEECWFRSEREGRLICKLLYRCPLHEGSITVSLLAAGVAIGDARPSISLMASVGVARALR